MAYTVLARKYRSQSFGDIVGQEAISQTLKNAIKTGRVAHAYLFTGTRGVGKTTTARILAKALNCLAFDEPATEPCCKCESCIAVNAGEDIDVIEIDGATNNGVEQVRQLRQNAIYSPARARYKIYIIDEVHMLSVGAFNALLKILEEPPSHVKFIFATTEPNKVIPTIQSRCQKFDFGNITAVKIADQLKKILKEEKIKYDDDILLPLAKMANGSMRDALSLLDRLISTGSEPLTAGMLEEFLGKADTEKVANLIARIGDSDAAETIAAVNDLIDSGMTESLIVGSVIDYMRDMMIAKSAGADSEILIMTAEQRKKVAELAAKFDIAGLVYNITALEKLRWSVKNSDTARALLEAAMLRFALSEHFLNVDALLSRSKTRPSAAVKKKPVTFNRPVTAETPEGAACQDNHPISHIEMTDSESVKSNWPAILNIIAEKLGESTRSVLNSASVAGFENSLLTLTFPASEEISKRMCESNGRAAQIESLLLDISGKPVKLKLTLGPERPNQDKASADKAKTVSRKNEILNDPGVKMVLTELSATVTDIKENRGD